MCAKETEQKKKRGTYNSSLQSLMDIWDVLATHASPDHPLTAGEIAKHLSRIPGQNTYASAQTVARMLPAAVNTINKLFPQTILCEAGKDSVLYTYTHQQTLHVVLETPNTESFCEEQMAVILALNEHTPIPYSTLTRILPQFMREYDAKKSSEEEYPPISLAGVVAQGTKSGKIKYIPAVKWEDSEKNSDKQSPPRRFFLESILSSAQWRILSDLILVYPYISEQETSKFLAAMKRLAPGVRNWSGARYAHKTNEAVNFDHIQKLDDAIQNQYKVVLKYGKYQLIFDTDGRWKPQLLPIPSKKNGLITVEPYAMMWSNGYYYLICKDDNIMRNLRVDRILEVQSTTYAFEKDPEFNPYTYRDRSPVMYPGQPTRIRLRCHTSLLSTLMDFFGTTITEYSKQDTEGYTVVTLMASTIGTRLFALQYADRVEVLTPESLRKDVEDTLRSAADRYQQQNNNS